MGEKRLVKGTYPHITPVVSRQPLTRPASRAVAARCGQVGPAPIGSSSCPRERGHQRHQQLVALPDAFAGDIGWYIVQRPPCRRYP